MGQHQVLPVFLFSLCILPFSIWLAVSLFIYVKLRSYLVYLNWPLSPLAVRKRVLLTGDDDGAILSTARVLRASGSSVYVVKQERIPHTSSLWTSKSIYKYIGLASGRLTPILRRVTKGTRFVGRPGNLPGTTLNLIESEKIDLWMHCDSGKPSIAHMQTKEIVLKHTATKLFEPEFDIARLSRGFSLFANHMKRHESEISCPKTVVVRSRAEIHDLLWKAPKDAKWLLERSATQYISAVKANSGTKRDSGYDDSSTLVGGSSDSDDSFDNVDTSTPIKEYTQLPLSNPNHTYSTVASMEISQSSPWIMHEVISGKPGAVSTLVVNGKIKAFAARVASQNRTFSTASSRSPWSNKAPISIGAERNIKDWQQHEQTSFIDPKSTIGTALLGYAQRFVATLPDRPSTYLNLDFFLTDKLTKDGAEQKIVATGCNFDFTPLLTQEALACGLGEQLGRMMTTGGVENFDESPLLLPTSPSAANGERSSTDLHLKLPRSVSANGESLNALATSLEKFINEQDGRYDGKDLVPWIWFWMVQGPIEIAFDGLVLALENAQARADSRRR